jgi:hypothetical protein
MPIDQTGQTPQPLIPGYRKLSDFVQPQPPREQLQETQEIAVIPRMKLPAINMTTGESVVPWVTAWSNKGKASFTPIYKRIEQTPYTPFPEMFSEIETIHLPAAQPLNSPLQTNQSINTFVSTEKGASHLGEWIPKKQRKRSIWKYVRTIFSRFFINVSKLLSRFQLHHKGK